MLRSVPTRWFELLVAREDLSKAVETLAATLAIELETQSETTAPLAVPAIRAQLEEYAQLARRYQPYWPEPDYVAGVAPKLLLETMAEALGRLYAWRDEAEPKVRALEHLRAEATELALLRGLLDGVSTSGINLGRFADAGLALASRLYVLPLEARVQQVPPAVLIQSVTTEAHDFLFAVGPREEIENLDRELMAHKARRISVPAFLGDDWRDAGHRVVKRIRTIDGECRKLFDEILAIADQHRVGAAIADIQRLEWYLEHASRLPVSENFGWVTGWTSDPDGVQLRRRLEEAGVRGLLRLAEPPPGKLAPTVMQNPWWAIPFELFASLLGTPGGNEVDPSRLLALLVPLLFGYMFGDVGQGAVLVLGGYVLSRRFPLARLFIAGGLAAIVFGFAFGSVFSREDIIEPLWLNPLEAPIPVLVIPLLGGVIVIMLGLLLNGIEANWRGELKSWMRLDAALFTLYLSLVLCIWRPEFMALAATALIWYLAGLTFESRHRGKSVGGGIGHLLESTLQLAVNTISFARVGAFALAHAGVSLAIVTIADTSRSVVVRITIMVIGNVIVIVLEGLVVFIQTTRLVLFEFFIRFLRGEGRVFRPLTPPAPPQASNLRRT
jgi:V/A-type H+-transporting ATPase subunit I